MQHGNRYEPVINDKNMADLDMTERRQGAEKARAKGFGEELRAAREAQGISLGDMAVRSRLSVAQLRALENEEVEKLPEPVYVRAFIRGCAQSLGLGAVWTAAYPYEDRMAVVRTQLRLPDGILPLCVIPVGYPASAGTPKMKYDAARIHNERW